MSGMSEVCIYCSSDPQRFLVASYKIVRGALDFGGVVGRMSARSRYGGA